MLLTKQILNIKSIFLNILNFSIHKIAILIFNYPKNPGMPIMPTDSVQRAIFTLNSSLPVFKVNIPPVPSPKKFLQALFGNLPKVVPIKKHFYVNKTEGFYNFYIQNYQNIFFLPDWVSRWIQVNWKITTDTSSLEVIRDSIFFGLLGFSLLLQFRLKLYWFLTINPYTRPWIYLISLTDWVYDFMSGFTPTSFGIDMSPMIVLGLIGKLMDSLNTLVFTMPYLPSEGVPGKIMINKEPVHVLVFRNLPALWYLYPIPNSLRTFWYFKRPDILSFMKHTYHEFNINFLPDKLLNK